MKHVNNKLVLSTELKNVKHKNTVPLNCSNSRN